MAVLVESRPLTFTVHACVGQRPRSALSVALRRFFGRACFLLLGYFVKSSSVALDASLELSFWGTANAALRTNLESHTEANELTRLELEGGDGGGMDASG